MPSIPGLRSNYAKVGRLVYVGRMLDLNEFDEGRDPVAERAWEKA